MGELVELRKLRKYHELTLEDMGKLIGKCSRAYSNKEKGISQFELSEMVIISQRFNKSMEEIFLNKSFK